MSPTVYLVSGANRGIGLGLVTILASRTNTIVFAGARNPSASKDLHALEAKHPGKVYIVKLTSGEKAENEAAVAKIKEVAGRLDVVIANAGIGKYFGPALETPAEEMREHFEVNVIGTLVLFQAAYPLLKASTPSPKFIPISSVGGSITEGAKMPIGMLSYGVSKAAENYLARKLHFEHDGLICFPMDPGPVATDMSELGRRSEPMMREMQFITIEESAKMVLEQVDVGVRQEDGTKLVGNDGTIWAW